MKTSTIKSALIFVILFFATFSVFSQDAVGIRIDVRGSRYSDQMWVFHDQGTTRGFDNGYDGYKMFSTNTLVPQIFAMEETANFQIDAVPDMNNTYIAFKAGEDSVYTLTFTSANLNMYYTGLYLQDLLTNEIIDIYTSGVTHTFNVKPTAVAEKRFVILSSLPVVEVPVDTTVVDTTINDKPIILPDVPADTTVTEQPTDVVDENIPEDSDDINAVDKNAKLKIKVKKSEIVIENSGNSKGSLKVINSLTGSVVSEFAFKAKSTTYFDLSYNPGIYLLVANTATDTATKRTSIK